MGLTEEQALIGIFVVVIVIPLALCLIGFLINTYDHIKWVNKTLEEQEKRLKGEMKDEEA